MSKASVRRPVRRFLPRSVPTPRGFRFGAARVEPSFVSPGLGVSVRIETEAEEVQVFVSPEGAISVSDAACNEWLCVPRGMSRRAFLEELERAEAEQARRDRKRLARRGGAA